MLTNSHIPKNLRQILSQYINPTEEMLSDLERVMRLVKVEKGESVVRQGEVCDDFVFNRYGLFRVCCVVDEHEDTLLFGTSGDIFTSLHSLYAKEPSIFSLQAVVDSEVWLVSYAQWNRLEQKYPVLIRFMRDLLIEQLYSFEKRYQFFNNKSAEERFLNFLSINNVSLRRTSVKYISRIVPLKYIAQYLKITQSTLSRLRKRLVTRGSVQD